MYNYNYEDENINYNREPLSQRPNYYGQNVDEIYKKDRRYYPITNYKNIESNISSLNRPPNNMSSMEFESNPLKRSGKSQRFQNENATIYRVSPYHYQYISRLQDDDNNSNSNSCNNIYLRDYNYQVDKNSGDQSYNIERERKFKNYNQYLNSKSINRHLNYLERNVDYKKDNINYNIDNKNYNNINTYNNLNKKIDNINDYNFRKNNNMNIKYKTPNEYSYRENRNNRYSKFNNELPLYQSDQIRNNNYNNDNENISSYRTMRNSYNANHDIRRDENRRYIMKRNNSDLNFVYNNNYNKDRFIENERYRNQSQRKYESNEYYDNMGIKSYNEQRNYYNPERNDYKGSRYGDYTYNYYLNGPMRGDISKDWRFPPIYYYRPNRNIRNNLYSNVNDENYIKDKFFNENI